MTFDASIVRRTVLGTLSSGSGFIAGAPVLAVEVIELDEDPGLLAQSVNASLRCGVRTVWVIDPDEPLVVVHRRNESPEYLNGGMWLSGGDDLPGFRCPVAEIFE